MNKKQVTSSFILLLASIIWGLSFVVLRVGMDYVGPFTFVGLRFVLAALTLIPVMHLMKRASTGMEESATVNTTKKNCSPLIAGIVCGTILFIGTTLQTMGLIYTTAGKAGFVTALYIIFVPIISYFLKKRPGIQIWIGAVIGIVGLYLLCLTESFTMGKGDFIELIGAFFWTGHILFIDYFAPKVSDSVKMSFIQFVTCAIFGIISALIFEKISIDAILSGAIPILYSGILAAGLAYTLQIIGQKNANPTVASLVMSTEAVFAAIFGFLMLGELLTGREFTGCVLMFCAIIISQLPGRKKTVLLSQEIRE